MIKRLSIIIILCVLMHPPHVFAALGLSSLMDITNNSNPSETATHVYSFSLPSNAVQISTSDYIQISLDNYSDVTIATGITGQYTGTPTITLDGKTIKITNIIVTPGANIVVNGITATNPAALGYQTSQVLVSEDEAGLIIRNIGYVQATTSISSVTVTANIDTPQAIITISGKTAPATFVYFIEDGIIKGTDYSDYQGNFAQIFLAQSPGDHIFDIYSIDSNDLNTSPMELNFYAPVSQVTSVSDFILSPSMQISSSTISQGDDLVASGSAIPGGQITIFTDTPLRTYSASAAASGLWDYTITNTSDYIVGDYRIYGLVQDGYGVQSINSNSINFSVVSGSSGGGTQCGDITHGDLNCDGSINLIDFSMLMYYWGTNDVTTDINNDGLVNLTDFSILMYWWGT